MNQVRKLRHLQLAQLDAGRNVPDIASAFNSIGRTPGKLTKVGPAEQDRNGRFVQKYTWDKFPMCAPTIIIAGYGVGETKQDPDNLFCTRTEILTRGHEPDKIKVSFELELGENVRALAARNYKFLGELIDDVPALNYRVKWKEVDGKKGDYVLDTNYNDDHDQTFIFTDEFGAIMVVEAAVVFRKGRPYVTLQELFSGHIVLGYDCEADKQGVKTRHAITIDGEDCFGWVVSETHESAYPGFDFLHTFRWGSDLINWAVANRRFLNAEQCNPAPMVWTPPTFDREQLPDWAKKNWGEWTEKEGWEPLAVAFYNESGGIGRCFPPRLNDDGSLQLDADGNVMFYQDQVFIHFNQLMDERKNKKDEMVLVPVVSYDYPTFAPMSWVMAKVFHDGKGYKTSALRAMPKEVFEDKKDDAVLPAA